MKWLPFTLIFAALYAVIVVWLAIDAQHVLDRARPQANPAAAVSPAALVRPKQPSQLPTPVMEVVPPPDRSATARDRRERSRDDPAEQMVTDVGIDHRPTGERSSTVESAQRAGRSERRVPPDELARETEKTMRESAAAFEAFRAMAAKQ